MKIISNHILMINENNKINEIWGTNLSHKPKPFDEVIVMKLNILLPFTGHDSYQGQGANVTNFKN